jgi:hypothetical protein
VLPPRLSFGPDHLFATKERKDHKEVSFVFLVFFCGKPGFWAIIFWRRSRNCNSLLPGLRLRDE